MAPIRGGGGFNFYIRGTHRGVGTDLNTLAWLAKVVPNCLVASYDLHSESSGKFLTPYLQWGGEGGVRMG